MQAALDTGVPDVTVGVRRRGRVRLGGHDPSKRREGRVYELRPTLFAQWHLWRGWDVRQSVKERKGVGKGEG